MRWILHRGLGASPWPAANRILAGVLLAACTDETPYVFVDEPVDLAYSSGAVYRLEEVESCGDPSLAGPPDPFQRVVIDNRLDVPIVAMTWSPDPCAPFDDATVDPDAEVQLAFVRGGTLRILDEALEPLHTWLVVGQGGVVVR